MRLRVASAISVLVVLTAVAGAQAALPTTHTNLIVPVKSLAGVKLGSSLAAATAAWGKGGTCNEGGCQYGSTISKVGEASFQLAQTSTTAPIEVVRVGIEAGVTNDTASGKKEFNTPLDRFKTAKGIGIGSTLSALKHAYPHVKSASAVGSVTVYTLLGPGESFTLFEVTEGRVYGISMQSVHLG